VGGLRKGKSNWRERKPSADTILNGGGKGQRKLKPKKMRNGETIREKEWKALLASAKCFERGKDE